MLSKTIAKFSEFVISIVAATVCFSGCDMIHSRSSPRVVNDNFMPPKVIGKIANPGVDEASGLAASKCQADVFWTHNDSGDENFIYAINSAGDNLGTFRVLNAVNDDWEDIAEIKGTDGKCYVYIGDIGNNGKRESYTIYRIPEPVVSSSTRDSTRKNAINSEPAQVLNFSYPEKVRDAETLMVHPTTGDVYILTKNKSDPSDVFKITPTFGTGAVQQATRVGEIRVPSIPVGLLTGGDISPDGRRVILCDYIDGFELTLPTGDKSFDDIWKQQPVELDLGKRDTGEAVAYGPDGSTIYATTEGKNAPVIEVRRK